ncbi:unnamed protein product [Cylicocyclus nassatus]|uniref:Uncharacterized protein n=1 Tax=Cylicocyclus nassatus TaxID=53992 RepID=A0AA36GSI6_CYLNA|nr:unnamed protein product [Cylicocyclus nassatus]
MAVSRMSKGAREIIAEMHAMISALCSMDSIIDEGMSDVERSAKLSQGAFLATKQNCDDRGLYTMWEIILSMSWVILCHLFELLSAVV